MLITDRLDTTVSCAVLAITPITLKLSAMPDLSYWGITLNVGNGEKSKGPLGQNAKVRQALDLSIDREAINQVVFNGEFVPGNQWISPENFYYQIWPVDDTCAWNAKFGTLAAKEQCWRPGKRNAPSSASKVSVIAVATLAACCAQVK